MTPADRKCRSWRSCWRPASPICARMESAGIALEDAQGMVYARLTADADQFLTMAKFRALRLLWARIEASQRPRAKTVVHRRRHRMADADPARSLCEHAARDDGDIFRRPRRRRQHHRAAAYAGAGIARSVRAPRGAQHATGAAGRIQSRKGVRSRGRLRRHRNPDASSFAKRHGRCFRRSRRPAACSPPSSKT